MSLAPSPLQPSLHFPALWTWTFYALHGKRCTACVLSRLAPFTWLSSWATDAVEHIRVWFLSKAEWKRRMYSPLLWPCALRLTPRLRLCELCYVVDCTNTSSSPRLVLLGMLRSGTAGPRGKCMFNLGLGTHARISILTGFWTGLPSLQQFTRLLFLPFHPTSCPGYHLSC